MLTYDAARPGSVARARELRRNSTDAERKHWRALRTQLGQFKWRRQMPVGPYFADFACFSAKLIVEIDGGQHAAAAEHDQKRSVFIEAQGYRVLRFWNHDVLRNTRGVLERIALELSTSPSRASTGPHESTTFVGTLGAGPSLSQGRGETAENL